MLRSTRQRPRNGLEKCRTSEKVGVKLSLRAVGLVKVAIMSFISRFCAYSLLIRCNPNIQPSLPQGFDATESTSISKL